MKRRITAIILTMCMMFALLPAMMVPVSATPVLLDKIGSSIDVEISGNAIGAVASDQNVSGYSYLSTTRLDIYIGGTGSVSLTFASALTGTPESGFVLSNEDKTVTFNANTIVASAQGVANSTGLTIGGRTIHIFKCVATEIVAVSEDLKNSGVFKIARLTATSTHVPNDTAWGNESYLEIEEEDVHLRDVDQRALIIWKTADVPKDEKVVVTASVGTVSAIKTETNYSYVELGAIAAGAHQKVSVEVVEKTAPTISFSETIGPINSGSGTNFTRSFTTAHMTTAAGDYSAAGEITLHLVKESGKPAVLDSAVAAGFGDETAGVRAINSGALGSTGAVNNTLTIPSAYDKDVILMAKLAYTSDEGPEFAYAYTTIKVNNPIPVAGLKIDGATSLVRGDKDKAYTVTWTDKADYTDVVFDLGKDGGWSVSGNAGVTIDEDGVLAVSSTARTTDIATVKFTFDKITYKDKNGFAGEVKGDKPLELPVTISSGSTPGNPSPSTPTPPTADDKEEVEPVVVEADEEKVEAVVEAIDKILDMDEDDLAELEDVVVALAAAFADDVDLDDVPAVEFEIPASILEGIAALLELVDENDLDIEVSLEVDLGLAVLTLDAGTLAGLLEDEGDIVMTVARVDVDDLDEDVAKTVGDRPIFKFEITVDGEVVSEFGGNITVAIPYVLGEDEDANAIIVYYINAKGELILMNGGYDAATKSVVFTTSHFSMYFIDYVEIDFTDLPDWLEKEGAAVYLAARGLILGVSADDEEFGADVALTRAELLSTLMLAFGYSAADADLDFLFDDVDEDSVYAPYIALAAEFGITTGYEDKTFRPERLVSREEMATLIFRTLKEMGIALPAVAGALALEDFDDADLVQDWAEDAVEAMVAAGIMRGMGGDVFGPKAGANRGQMTAIVYRLLTGVVIDIPITVDVEELEEVAEAVAEEAADAEECDDEDCDDECCAEEAEDDEEAA